MILTFPTPELSKSPVFPHLNDAQPYKKEQDSGPLLTPQPGPSGLEFRPTSRDLGFGIDELGALCPTNNNEVKDGCEAEGYASETRLRSTLRRGGRGRRAWNLVSRFLSIGRQQTAAVAEKTSGNDFDTAPVDVSIDSERRRLGLGLLGDSGRKRWFHTAPRVGYMADVSSTGVSGTKARDWSANVLWNGPRRR